MMAHYCQVCGKKLQKTHGPVGPVCLKKYGNKNLKCTRVPKQVLTDYLKKHDLFGDNDEQGQNAETSSDTSSQA